MVPLYHIACEYNAAKKINCHKWYRSFPSQCFSAQFPTYRIIFIKKITFQLADQEFDLLESYCEQTERGKTEVLRELIRGLKLSTKSNDNCASTGHRTP